MKRFVCLTFLLYLIVSSDGCEQAKVKDCIVNYMRELDDFPDGSNHCKRLRDVVKCFWSDFHCTGRMINRWRVWVLQVASLEKFLDICPKVDDQKLQKLYDLLPEDSKISLRYNIMQNADIATVDQQCAKAVHLSCSKRFVDAMKANRLICVDGQAWLGCYKDTDCSQESLIFRYAKYVGKLAPKLVKDCDVSLHNSDVL